jgi:hypothetical protein
MRTLPCILLPYKQPFVLVLGVEVERGSIQLDVELKISISQFLLCYRVLCNFSQGIAYVYQRRN